MSNSTPLAAAGLISSLLLAACSCGGPQPCEPAAVNACPDDLVCRPSLEGAICQSPETAGRIPSCKDPEALDVFAAEANQALSISWVLHASVDPAEFRVRYGTGPGQYGASASAPADATSTVISGLANGTVYFAVVEVLDPNRGVVLRSCEVFATPHALAFLPDMLVDPSTGGIQAAPALAANLEGTRLFLAFEDSGKVVLAQSIDFGDTWSIPAPVASGTTQTRPALAVRDAVLDDAGSVVAPELLFITWVEGGRVLLSQYTPGSNTFGSPVDLGAGDAPDVAVGGGRVYVASESSGTIAVRTSAIDPLSFAPVVQVSGSTTQAHAPRLAARSDGVSVFVAWHALLGSGDTNIYFAASGDSGSSFGTPIRVDDSPTGQNQLNVSLAVDQRTGKLYATWEDRRNGADVYFSVSENGGTTWSANINVGAGLGGDQFRPRAVVDAAGNVYVALQDTTNGARVVFSRFNQQGSFDPPLPASTAAGVAGVVADKPTVATDAYGAVYVAWQENRNGPDTDVFFARAE